MGRAQSLLGRVTYFTKLQFEYEQTRFEQGAATGNRPTEKAFLERLQIAF